MLKSRANPEESVEERKLFQVINALLEKTKRGLIEWRAGGTNDNSWDAPIGKVWVSISKCVSPNSGYAFQAFKDQTVLVNICTTANCMDALYHLVSEKMSTENKILDQLLVDLENIVPQAR